MNNLTIKKSDATTSVTYVAKRGANASTPCLYTLDASSTIATNRPRLTISDRLAQGGKSQRVEVQYTYPATVSVNGNVTLVGSVPINATFVIPFGVEDAVIKEACTQFANLLSTADVQAAIQSGFAPR